MGSVRWTLLFVCFANPLAAQLPFYTDDPAVTEAGKWHFEFFNEYDVLQLQFPNVRQNTANGKLNYGLPHNLELDVDYPYLGIFRALEIRIRSAAVTLISASSGSTTKNRRAPAFPRWASAYQHGRGGNRIRAGPRFYRRTLRLA